MIFDGTTYSYCILSSDRFFISLDHNVLIFFSIQHFYFRLVVAFYNTELYKQRKRPEMFKYMQRVFKLFHHYVCTMIDILCASQVTLTTHICLAKTWSSQSVLYGSLQKLKKTFNCAMMDYPKTSTRHQPTNKNIITQGPILTFV